MDTDRGHGPGWSGAFVDRLGEVRTYARTTGRRTVRRAFVRARARIHGSEVALRWPRASLRPGYDVAIVGGDLAGLWLAFELSERAHLRVAVLDRGLVGERWPSRARVPVSEVAAPPSMAPLVRRSVARLAELATERDLPLSVGRVDIVTLGRTERDLRALAARVAALPAAMPDQPCPEVISSQQASEIIGHHLDPLCAAGAVLEAGARVADVKVLPWVLGGLAAGRGADIVERCAVQRIEAGAAGWELATTCGSTVATTVVDATAGAELLVAAAMPHGSFWHRWETLLTEPVQPFLRAVVQTAAGEVSQTDEGEVQLSGRSGGALSQTDRFPLAGAAALAAGASDALPALARLRLVAHWQRTDLLAPDGLPVAGASGEDGLLRIGGFGGHHIALAPAVAEGVARQLLRQPARLSLEALAPDRLGGSSRQLDLSDPGSDANREVSPM